MGFSQESIARYEQQQRRSRWITTPGSHIVKISSWQYSPPGKRRYVVFDLCNDEGREQRVEFSLSVPVLRTGELLRFVVAALHWDEHAGNPLAVARASTFNELVGRRVAVAVVKTAAGLHRVVDWGSVRSDG